ncbi:hypothetical protein B0I35DRAFT_443489 [Stachybotrys elegans]|uniref:Uncharacterized protein n=1 Tax=Stachybotrys elegans TaxID=80388 RepID=A0A8K0SBS8_9HYPO|nr:hypothetical protein B0I35DRAFT_443489 [Stachybotrys elegans]
MSENQGQTLEEHVHIDFVNIRDNQLNHIIRGMQQTGFHKWGFVIYRCTYSDDAAWLRYVHYMRNTIMESLELHDLQLLLSKYLYIPVIEDRERLDGASKTVVRNTFAEKADRERKRDQGGPGTATIFAKMLPRFNYCLYVDRACLGTLLAREQWEREEQQGQHEHDMPPDVVCAIIDTDCEPEGEGKDGYEPVEGCTRYFPGWMYCCLDLLTPLYNRLHHQELIDGWQTYERPPGIANALGGQRMPL